MSVVLGLAGLNRNAFLHKEGNYWALKVANGRIWFISGAPQYISRKEALNIHSFRFMKASVRGIAVQCMSRSYMDVVLGLSGLNRNAFLCQKGNVGLSG